MKESGDVYVGELVSYPIARDTEPDKDFLITKAHYYRGGNFEDGQDLSQIDNTGAVLLNSGNVESIRIVYSDRLKDGSGSGR